MIIAYIIKLDIVTGFVLKLIGIARYHKCLPMPFLSNILTSKQAK